MAITPLRVALAGAALLAGAAAYKIHGLMAEPKAAEAEIDGPKSHTGGMTRVSLFGDQHLTTEHLRGLITHRNESGVAVPEIDESRVEETLKPLIRERIHKVFISRGLNFEELEGKVYYDVVDLTVEVYVLWKNRPSEVNYSNYDRFTITF